MSSDRDGNVVETVNDRGDASSEWDWVVERWKSEQRTSTPSEKPPERFRLGGRIGGPVGRGGDGGGGGELGRAGDGEPMPRARGSSPALPMPVRDEDDNDADPLAALAAAADAMSDDLDDDEEAEPLPEAPEVSRKHRPRHRRRDRPRSKTIAMKRLTREALRAGAIANPPVEGVERPQTRAECRDMPRPCPWVACKHHLYLDINPKTGSIKINFPDLEPWELQHTCSLDIAENGGLTLEEIGTITNLTRERVRQVEVRGLLTLKSRSGSLK